MYTHKQRSGGRTYEDNGPRGTPGAFVFVGSGKGAPDGSQTQDTDWTIVAVSAPEK